jgi:hypothetical protein
MNALTIEQKRELLQKHQDGTLSTEDKKLIMQQVQGAQPSAEQVKVESPTPTIQEEEPKVELSNSNGILGTGFYSDKHYEDVLQSFENANIPMRQIQAIPNELMSEWLGEIASIPAAIKGAEFASKLPIGHPLLKGVAMVGAGAVSAGVGQVFGEIGEDVWKGTAVDYRKALEEGVETAKWDAAGGLVLGSLGTITKKALRTAGIESTDDAVKSARKLLQEYGADLTWYQTTGTKLSAIVEGIGLVGLGGKEILDTAIKKQENALEKQLSKFFTPTGSQEFGDNIINIMNDARSSLSKSYGSQYDAIYEAGAKIPVDLTKYNREIIDQIKSRAGARKTIGAAESNSFINEVNTVATDLIDVTNMADLNNTIKELKRIRRAADDAGGAVGREGRRYASKQIKSLEKVMGNSAQKLAPDLKKKLDFLNFNFAKAIGRLESRTMMTAVRRDPSEVGSWVYRNPDKAKDFMRFLGQARSLKTLDKAQYDKALSDYRSGYIKTLIREEGASLDDMVRLSHNLKKGKNREKLRSIVGLPVEKRLEAIMNAAELTQKRAAGKLSLIVASKQAESVKQLALIGSAVVSPTAAITLLTGPLAMAKAASTSQTFGQWMKLNTGLKKAADSGDLKAVETITKRISQWASEEEE